MTLKPLRNSISLLLRHKYLSFTLCVFIISACASQKAGEPSKFKKAYHGFTGEFNGYYNADVLVDETIDKLNSQHQDNYAAVLDLYPYIAVENPKSVASEMNIAIEKTAVVATVHRVGTYADDSYLLMGKAQFLQHSYADAQETFEYLTEMYDPIKGKKNQKAAKAARAEAKKEADQLRQREKKEKKSEKDAQKKQDKEDKDAARKEKAKDRADAKKEADAQKAADKKEAAAEKKAADIEKAKEQAAKEKSKEQAKKEKEKDRKQTAKEKEKARKEKEQARKQAAKDRANKPKGQKTSPQVPKEEKIIETPKEEKKEEKKVEAPKVDSVQKKAPKAPKVKPKPVPKNFRAKMTKTGVNSTPLAKTKAEKEAAEDEFPKPPKTPFYKRRPAYQDGALWLAKTMIERENYADAQVLLTQMERNPKLYKPTRQDLAGVMAHLYLKQGNYEAAKVYLEKGLETSRRKAEKVRMAYILAQIYQKEGRNDQAALYFQKVLKYCPNYDMEFNTRLNIALNGSTSEVEATKALVKLSKDSKNKEYSSQINYALAQIALKNGKKTDALSFFQKSLGTKDVTPKQKMESYLALAQLYYDGEQYVKAKSYYDSTLAIIPKTDFREPEVKRYAENLTEVAKSLATIELKDSVLKIARMTPTEKRAIAQKIQKEELDRKAAEARAAAIAASSTGGRPTNAFNISAQTSAFFAYNQDAVKKGKKEFEKKWGNDRKLEDNWRRSNKRNTGASIDAPIATVDNGSYDLTDEDVQKILKGVPSDSTEMGYAEQQILDAYFTLGIGYREKMKNNQKAIDAFETMNRRFPVSKYELDSWYYLYLAYTDIENKGVAQSYYDKIQEKYPKTNYAQVLRDPNALKANTEAGKMIVTYYDSTYNVFKKGNYKQVVARIQESDRIFGQYHPYRAKFLLLGALVSGNTLGKDSCIAQLRRFTEIYPDIPENKQAKELLRQLEGGGTVVGTKTNSVIEYAEGELGDRMRAFKVDNDKLHYVIAILEKGDKLEENKTVLSDFNTKYFRLDDLKISNIYLTTDPEVPILVVRKFKDKQTAMEYMEAVQKNSLDFIKATPYQLFAVTQDNYREILKQRKADAYQKFFEQVYQQKY